MNRQEKVFTCKCGHKIKEMDWYWCKNQYGEMPVCGCVKCFACDTFVNPDQDDTGLKNLLCEEAGWITLCKDCEPIED